MITSIRFIGGDLGKPAVFLLLKDFPINTRAEVDLLADCIRLEYQKFKPQRFRWFNPQVSSDLSKLTPEVSGDQVYVYGFLDELKRQDKPKNADRIRLEVAGNLDRYPRYEAAYRKLCQDWPAFIEMGQLEDRATLEDLIRKELLFEAWIDGQWAGLIAADRGSDYIFHPLLPQ